MATAVAAGGEYANINMAASHTAIIITAATNGASQTQHVFFATSSSGGLETAVKVGTIGAVDIDSFVAGNFNI